MRVIAAGRRSRRRRTSTVQPEQVAGLIDAARASADDPERADMERVLGWLRRLPPAQAEVLLLRVLADLSCEQVAELMGKRAGSVRALQHRAAARLREEMLREGVTPRVAHALWRGDEPLYV
jgi:RNA polymerase sigma-70 factor (ECF subfamily)